MKSYAHGGPVHLEQEDIENVATYIRSFEKVPMTASRRVDRSADRVHEGGELYRGRCARCHGVDGLGKHGSRPGEFAPSLNNREFLKAADDNFLLATIALGRPGTPMPPFALQSDGGKPLSAEEIRKIVAYLRAWEANP
jgi:mono/diheme cytochrome c family protein